MTEFHAGILFGLISAVTFVVLGLWSREIQHREGPWRFLFYVNAVPALMAVVWWLIHPPDFSWPLLRAVLMAGVPAVTGLFFMGLAVRYADVSHVGPVMGSKALVATLLAVAFGFEPVGPELWAASGMLLVALFLASGNRQVLRRPWVVVDRGLVLGLLMCTFASLADLITRRQMHDHNLAIWDFVSMSWFVRGSVASVVLVAVCKARGLRVLPRRASTLWVTGPIVVAHGVAIVTAFRLLDSAVLANVLSSLRGVFSVLAVLLLGRWNIGRTEHLTRGMIAARVIGSLLIVAAVYLALSGRL